MEAKAKYLIDKQNQLIRTLNNYYKAVTSTSSATVPESIKQEIKELHSNFSSNQIKLESLAETDESKIEYNLILSLQEDFDEVYSQFINLFAQQESEIKTELKPTVIQSNSSINVPRVTIKHFSGNFLEWTNFKALYDASVHRSELYSDSQKLQILRSHLEGNALALIDTLPISDVNYAISYKLLCDKYDNIRSAANFHYSRLANLEPSDNEPETVRQIASVARSSFNAFKSLNIDLADFLFFKLIFRALPHNICSEFDRQCQPDTLPNVEQLFNFLNCLEKSYENSKYDLEYNCRSNLHVLPSHTSQAVNNSKEKPKQQFTRKSTALLLEKQAFNISKAKHNPKSHNTYCVICKSEAHNAYSCTDFLLLNVDGRYKQLASLNLCFNCLGTHKQSNCKSTKTCKICHSPKHNTLLHRFETTTPNNVGLVTSNVHSIQPSSSNQSYQPVHNSNASSHTSCANQDSCVYPVCHSLARTTPDVTLHPCYGNSGLPCSSPSALPNVSPVHNTQLYTPCSSNPHQPAVISPTHSSSTPSVAGENPGVVNNLSCKIGNKSVLLGTAVVDVLNNRNQRIKMRAVLDSGSEATIITQRAIVKLGLPVQESASRILGISASSAHVRGQTSLKILSPLDLNFNISCTALVVPNIVGPLPSSCLSTEIMEKFSGLQLADPNFVHSSPVDLLLGADMYANLIIPSQDAIIKGSPSAMLTVFGFVIFGQIAISPHLDTQHHSLLTTLDSVNNSLKMFWEIEEAKLPPATRPNDVLCEQLFKETTTRNEHGRYIVALPFKPHSMPLGDNSKVVSRNYLRFENRLARQPTTQIKYREFMDEYISLNHMQLAPTRSTYIIPHHCVIKESSSTTKLRTVFNASHCDGNGQSLNAQLLAGPKLQKDICSILMSFRLHPVVICADIKMMYRQILIRDEDRKHQHIIYRDKPNLPPREFELNTVTYGLTPSAYLAQRVLLQLTKDDGKDYPAASYAIRNHSYVDDILTGAISIETAQQLIDQLISLLNRGGFSLRKWSSNCPHLLQQFPEDHLENPHSFDDDSSSIKILGLQWNPKSDSFCYHIISFNSTITKRSILSYISKMFDPPGFLAPIIFWAKYFIQQLWASKLNWDDELPARLAKPWITFSEQLPLVTRITIPRLVGLTNTSVHLVGFCDASEKGYAAVFYLRTEHHHDVTVTLLKSKTRVAPIKTLTIPRLELSAALLLAQLYESIADSLSHLTNLQLFLYSDAKIVLTWLQIPAYRLKTFVSNRVRQILELTPASAWHYIPTHLNPADIASRGSTSQQLLNNTLWWQGPDFLQRPTEIWNSFHPMDNSVIPDSLLEIRNEQPILIVHNIQNYFITVFAKFSSYMRLIRVVAYVLRFINCTRNKIRLSNSPLTPMEIEDSVITCSRIIQLHHFPNDYKNVKSAKPVHCATLKPLTPIFCCSTKTLRAGGRLTNSLMSHGMKHPIILPKKSHFTTILCRHYHETALHAGPRTTQAIITQKFWIIGLRSNLRWIIHNCPKCIRYQGKPVPPLMADLPDHRVAPHQVFTTVGLDFAGPFFLKTTVIRNAKIIKSYLCVFVCTSTKAVHLECVSDLTTEAFLAAFDRFVSRRGLPTKVLSDNGTNFVGAAAVFEEIRQFLTASQASIQNYFTSRSIEWVFNPPSAPNFGGLWEAAVKSAKFHLHRVMHNKSLTFEEFSTLLARIEAVLNSRPLFEPSPDPNESCLTLTPGHFLIGKSLLQPPEVEVDSRMSLKSRWLMLRHLLQNFWNIWSKHYLHTVIQRNKWHKHIAPLVKDQVVIVYGVDSPPAIWPLARIVQLHPGKDGIVRVVTIQTAEGTYVRPVNKLIPLPTCINE